MKKIDCIVASAVLIGMTGSVLGGLNPMGCAVVSIGLMSAYTVGRLAYTAIYTIKAQRELLAKKNKQLAKIAEERDRQKSFKNFDLKAMMENEQSTQV